jgi:cellulose synthase/poly-beta-1,6-N-acetylglucosamine synthase-like glycosyltransferase
VIDLTWIWIAYGVFLAYFLTLALLYLTMLVVGGIGNRRRSDEVYSTDMASIASSPLTIPMSVLVPAHNEEGQVVKTVRSLLRSDFPEFEVIVVDDGSTDATLDRLREAFQLRPAVPVHEESIETRPILRIYQSGVDRRLTVVEKRNGGKADALNAGLNLARYRYVVHTDADGIFAPDALTRMARLINFDPARIIALGVTLRALNDCRVEDDVVVETRLPRRLVERFQVLEYTTVFMADRLGWSALNAVPVVSGGAGAWRRDALLRLGGYATDLTHEDFEITLRAHQTFRSARIPYRIVYLPDPVVWTEVPHTWSGLFAQRKRWQRTLYESIWRSRRMWFNPRYGVVGLLLLPYLLLYEALGPFVEAAAYLLTVFLLVTGVVEPWFLLAFLLMAGGLTTLIRLGGLVLDLALHQGRPAGEVLRLGGPPFSNTGSIDHSCSSRGSRPSSSFWPAVGPTNEPNAARVRRRHLPGAQPHDAADPIRLRSRDPDHGRRRLHRLAPGRSPRGTR